MNAVEMYKAGEQLKNEGKYEEAIAKFVEAIAADPQYPLPHHALAVCYGRIHQHDKAVEHAERACELEPQDPFSHMSLSVTYQRAFQGTQDMRYIRMAEDAMARSHALGGHRH